jgi:hypothetical protein
MQRFAQSSLSNWTIHHISAQTGKQETATSEGVES